MDNDELRSAIIQARTESGLFEDDMAEQYGISAKLYRDFELGTVDLPPELVYTIASDLGIPTVARDRSPQIPHVELP